jgi:hypothetical protein
MNKNRNTELFLSVAQRIVASYSQLPQVESAAITGSQIVTHADSSSDVDLFVYVREDIPLDVRSSIATPSAVAAEMYDQFWGPGDEWLDAETGIRLNILFRHVPWTEHHLDQVLRQYYASYGCSTCLWHHVRFAQIVYDRAGWLYNLQDYARQPYPEMLRRAIIAHNYPMLRQTSASYINQIKRAIEHGDIVSINHRLAAFLASYFDILFALNRLTHPGEKRLLEFAEARCTQIPIGMSRHVRGLVRSIGHANPELLFHMNTLVDGIGGLVRAEGLEPAIGMAR